MKQFNRRTALRGLGVSMALPWMESLAFAKGAAPAGAATAIPNRMGFVFVPNGVHPRDWRPATAGYDYELTPILKPLSRVQDDMLVLTGLTHDKGRANGDGPGDHARSASVFLTGAQPRKTSGANIRSGISVDQVAAKAVGHKTRFASVELGCEDGRTAGSCDSGYSCAYSSSISWSSEATPVGKEINPRLVFERFFAVDKKHEQGKSQARRDALRKSILDFVSEDAKQLQRRLGRNDQRKLEEYLNGVREIERRVTTTDDIEATVDYPTPSGIPKEYAEHIRSLSDMMVLAFQTDSTRICSFMFANAASGRSYRSIGVPDGHHDLSHHGGNEAKLDKIRKINIFHTTQLAYLLEKMKSIPEGDGTLLDHSMIMYGSAINDGNRHNNENLPVILAGGGGGTIDSGRHVVYEEETPMCNLFMAMLDRMDCAPEFHGDSTGLLGKLKL
ncbi:DUF1552 domain-containing protein [bacterium]|nr:DUF1552 domain-containing protein [bacterium]